MPEERHLKGAMEKSRVNEYFSLFMVKGNLSASLIESLWPMQLIFMNSHFIVSLHIRAEGWF